MLLSVLSQRGGIRLTRAPRKRVSVRASRFKSWRWRFLFVESLSTSIVVTHLNCYSFPLDMDRGKGSTMIIGLFVLVLIIGTIYLYYEPTQQNQPNQVMDYPSEVAASQMQIYVVESPDITRKNYNIQNSDWYDKKYLAYLDGHQESRRKTFHR